MPTSCLKMYLIAPWHPTHSLEPHNDGSWHCSFGQLKLFAQTGQTFLKWYCMLVIRIVHSVHESDTAHHCWTHLQSATVHHEELLNLIHHVELFYLLQHVMLNLAHVPSRLAWSCPPCYVLCLCWLKHAYIRSVKSPAGFNKIQQGPPIKHES